MMNDETSDCEHDTVIVIKGALDFIIYGCVGILLVGIVRLWFDYVSPKLYMSSMVKLYGLACKNGRSKYLRFVTKNSNPSPYKYKYPVYIDQMNDIFLGTKDGDGYDEKKAIQTVKDYHEFGLINCYLMYEILAFITFMKYHPNHKYNLTNVFRPEDQTKRIRTACKKGLEYFAQTGSKIVFALDGIDYTVWDKNTSPMDKFFTMSELKSLCRLHMSDYMHRYVLNNIIFINNFKIVEMPWNQAPGRVHPFWVRYINQYKMKRPIMKQPAQYSKDELKKLRTRIEQEHVPEHVSREEFQEKLDVLHKLYDNIAAEYSKQLHKLSEIEDGIRLFVVVCTCKAIRNLKRKDVTVEKILNCNEIIETIQKEIDQEFEALHSWKLAVTVLINYISKMSTTGPGITVQLSQINKIDGQLKALKKSMPKLDDIADKFINDNTIRRILLLYYNDEDEIRAILASELN